MNPQLLERFVVQVAIQCDFALISARQINDGRCNNNVTEVFCGVQNLVGAAANIAKVLWGSGGRRAEAREPIRRALDVAEDSPIRGTDLRNHFEHFDDRIDRWWRESRRHLWMDMNVLRKTEAPFYEDIERFRLFDPLTTDVTFWGDELNIQELVVEVDRILSVIEARFTQQQPGIR